MIRKLLACAAVLSLAACGTGEAEGPPHVTLAQGELEGLSRGEVNAFLGIPYAAAPVGDLRWRAPGEAPSWEGVREATRYGASCMQMHPAPQFGPYTPEFVDTPEPSEDCLFLNVWAPADADDLPVLVWIHGGGFLGGSGAVPIYDGTNLADAGVVVVTINYRVGPLGFLAHPALSAESGEGISGNYGLLDQVAALEWVRDNVAEFGGDPDMVTIAGQSAGAVAVNNLVMSPLASGLFHRAAAQSGSGMGVGAKTLAEGEAEGLAWGDFLNATTADELRALDAETIQAAVYMPIADVPADLPRVRFRPVTDGHVLLHSEEEAGQPPVNDVPLLTGFTADENGAMHATDVAGFTAFVNERFGASAPAILALYPHANDAEAAESGRLLARDIAMTSLVGWTNARSRVTTQPVWRYLFAQDVPVQDGPGFGAFHTAEVPYLFGNLDTALRPYTDEDRAVSARVQRYWLAFARTGDPNQDGLPAWARVAGEGSDVLRIGAETGMVPAVSSLARLAAISAYVDGGGTLSAL